MTPTELALVCVLVVLGSLSACLAFALHFAAQRRMELENERDKMKELLEETNAVSAILSATTSAVHTVPTLSARKIGRWSTVEATDGALRK